VFLVDGRYYWCEQGVWLYAATANGPWSFCTSVPAAIYTIPPTHPTYNVTYVVVQSSTPTTVVYSQTSGYSGQYVAATGVLMFGMGVLVGAAIADDHDTTTITTRPRVTTLTAAARCITTAMAVTTSRHTLPTGLMAERAGRRLTIPARAPIRVERTPMAPRAAHR